MKSISIKLTILLVCLIMTLSAFIGCDKFPGFDDGGDQKITITTDCNHKYGEWTLFSGEQCQDKVYKRVCSLCNSIDWKQGSENDHNMNSDGVCTICGYNKSNKEQITIWASDMDKIVELSYAQIAKFLESNPQYKNKYEFKVESFLLSDVANYAFADLSSVADIYCFDQHSIPQLLLNSALAPLDKNTSEIVKANNDKYSLEAATVDGNIYAYPMSSDNGYFLYYDKSVVKNPSDLQSIVNDCIAADRTFNFELESSSWYTASFFFGVGCTSDWTINMAGKFIAVDDDWNSDKGLIAMKGMQILTTSDAYYNSSSITPDSAAVVTGTWNSASAKELFGENLGVAKLPTFTVDGQTYQLGSFSGFKYMGVKPQEDPEKATLCSELAKFLTGEDCQLERYKMSEYWAPSNKNVQDSDELKSNKALHALWEQNAFSVSWVPIHGDWWNIATILGYKSKEATSDEELKDALVEYENSVKALIEKCDHESKSELSSDENYHWYECKFCDEIISISNHYFIDGVCKYCEFTNPENLTDLAGTYNITLWVDWNDGVAEQFQAQVDSFEQANPGIKINLTLETISSYDLFYYISNDDTDVDMYCFAQDQLSRLVQIGALEALPSNVGELIKSSNDICSVAAATLGDNIYAYPMTSDTGFFMYYDKSLFPNASDLDSMEKIIEICEANGKTIRFPLENGWYTSSFFFATGCSSTWSFDSKGTFNGVIDNYNSDAGLVAMRGMAKLAQSSCYNNDNETFTDIGVIISGTWASNQVKEVLGDNYAATDLPSFEVDGQSYHLGSYSQNKLLGVKPQADEKKAAVLSLLAQYLTGAECQEQRAEAFEWCPSNLVAQQSSIVQSDPALAALALQTQYAVPQGPVHAYWWNIAATLGVAAKDATSVQDLKDSLAYYEAEIKKILSWYI